MKQSQRGVGLMEVLVALFILAIAVLGFVALQLRAVNASIEAGNNVHATNIARDLAERMRVNRGSLRIYQQAASTANGYKGTLGASPTPGTVYREKCKNTACNVATLAADDFDQVRQRAVNAGMDVAIRECQNANRTAFKRLCVYVAWGDTTPTNGTGNNDCTNGIAYRPNAQCIIMETFNYD